MTLATKNGSIIVKDGKLAENCGCCGGWWCYLDQSATCSGAIPSVVFSMNFLAHPQLGDPTFGVTVHPAFASEFPKQITTTVSLAQSESAPQGYVARYLFHSQSFNQLGLGESRFFVTVDVNQASGCGCEARVTNFIMNWKWDKAAQQLSAGNPSVEPAGYQYGEIVFQYQAVGLVDESKILKTAFSTTDAQGLPSTTLSVNGKTLAGRGSADGAITMASGLV